MSVPESKRVMSEDVAFINPMVPYNKEDDNSIDHIWRNPTNGNSISYISNCKEQDEVNIEHLYSELFNSVEKSKEVKKEYFTFNNRRAIKSYIVGDIDGINTHISFVIFKKNKCSYVLSQIAIKKTYTTDIKYFNSFVKGFKAP
jgi:hypothetical protein